MLKRETSLSVSDLHLGITDNIKRLALSNSFDSKNFQNNLANGESYNSILSQVTIDNSNQTEATSNSATTLPTALALVRPVSIMSNNSNYMRTVLSTFNEQSFQNKYELGKEIGKGGFSMVYQCMNKLTGAVYAVKIIDLRPLRLRERFNPARLRREVDIMRRLSHTNIIQFIEVFETTDQLLMVMEYCPGHELFDVILAKKRLNEDEAKPIFAQITKAIFYLHSMNIIHRDIKPENILIVTDPNYIKSIQDQKLVYPVIAKLLDFGLSKNAGFGGSEAKTFVGTPCYLAPEVEFTSKGLGGTYGLPADCWSLGAVLYVMLVARFPEFEQDQVGNVTVKLTPALWNNISMEAKDLIKSLMVTNPNIRLTARQALQHPWLAQYRLSTQELNDVQLSCTNMSHDLQQEEMLAEQEYAKFDKGNSISAVNMTSTGTVIHNQAMIVLTPVHPAANQQAASPHTDSMGTNNDIENSINYPLSTSNGADNMQLAPLLHLQRNILTCLEYAHFNYQEMPEVATQIRRGAVLCRHQVNESTTMLRKVEQTAAAVINLFPDLELAIEVGEPRLATEFFNVVKVWVSELRELVKSTQQANHASMMQIQAIVEQSTESIKQSKQNLARNHAQKQLLTFLQASANNRNISMNVSNKSKQFNLPISSTVTNIRQLSDEYETKNKLSQNSSDTSNDQRNGVEETPIPLNNQSQLGPNSSKSTEEISLNAEQILNLFFNLFGGPPVSTQVNLHSVDTSLNKADDVFGDFDMDLSYGDGLSSTFLATDQHLANGNFGGSPIDDNMIASDVTSDFERGNSIESYKSVESNDSHSSNLSATGNFPTPAGIYSTPPRRKDSGYASDLGNSPPTTNGTGTLSSKSLQYNQVRPKFTSIESSLHDIDEGPHYHHHYHYHPSKMPADIMNSSAIEPNYVQPNVESSNSSNLSTNSSIKASHSSNQAPIEVMQSANKIESYGMSNVSSETSETAGKAGGRVTVHHHYHHHHANGSTTTSTAVGHVVDQRVITSSNISTGGNGISNPLSDALMKLRQVDMILDQLGFFWAQTELVLDSLTKKGQHVEQFIGYCASNPKLMARFQERLEEYKRFWENISLMCTNYINGAQNVQQQGANSVKIP